MNKQPFLKMHGIGNDFVVIDGRRRQLDLSRRQARAIADRRTGVGGDQLIVIEPPRDRQADAFMRIYNSDGGQAEACGNATRCVASLVMDETGAAHAIIETVAGLLDCEAAENGQVSVDMGQAGLDWRDIPTARAIDTAHLDISSGPLQDPVGVGMGNPHAVFFVDDADAVDLAVHGPAMENHPIFPQRANIGVATILSRREIRLRVWERGVGETLACGSGACAAIVAAVRRGLCGREADVHLNGGILQMQWLADGHVLMTGPVATSFSGVLDDALCG